MSRETSLGEATVTLLCKTFGISTQAYYAARKRKNQPTSARSFRKPRQGPWAADEEVRAGILEVVEENPAWGVRKVWAVLRHRRGLVVSRKRVWKLMKEMGLTLPPVRERNPDVPRGTVVVPESDRRWASDMTTVWTRKDGVVAITPLIDCGDRYVFDVGVSKSQRSASILDPIERSLASVFGDPCCVPYDLELRTDHGPQYIGVDCQEMCRRWGVEHTMAPIGRPTGNAVAERVIQTLKVELIWTRDWESVEELRAEVRDWQYKYNHERPHQSLGWRTPAEERINNLGLPTDVAA